MEKKGIELQKELEKLVRFRINEIRGSGVLATCTGQSNSSLGKVPIEILPEKPHITWVLGVVLFTAEFQMEPLVSNTISHNTRPMTY